jgi:GAF domain-containing protein
LGDSTAELKQEIQLLRQELAEARARQAVTTRQAAVEKNRLLEEVQVRGRELAESLEQQAAMSAILRVIAASPTDIKPVLNTVVENAAKLCDAYDTTIFLRSGEALSVAAHTGAIPVDFAELPLRRDVVIGRAVIDRSPVHVHDLPAAGDEFRFGRELAQRLGFHTILASPLLREGEAIGALMIRRAEVRPFSDKQIELLKTFGDQAVIAIENVRLFEEAETRNRALIESLERQTAMSEILRVISSSPTDVQPVFETIAENAARLCSARFCAVFRFDGELVHFAAQHGMPPEGVDAQRRAYPLPPSRSSTAARAILNAAVEQIPDVEADPDYKLGETARAIQARSILAVPMLYDGRPVGSISIARSAIGDFPSRQIELLKTFADQAAIAIHNVRLFEEVQSRNRDLTESLERQTAMSDILRVISRSPADVQPVFETIAESAARLCRGKFCAVFRFDGELIHFMAQYGMSAAATELQRRAFPSAPGQASAAARAILSAKVVQIPDVELDSSFALGTLTKELGIRSVLAVPILRDGRAVGSINIGRPETGEFGSRQIDLLQTFADQAVIAIENVRLFDEVQARTAEVTEALEQQTATADVLKVISRSAFNLDAVLQTLVDSAIRLCGADKGAITLREGDALLFRAGAGQQPELRAYEQANPHRLGRGTFQGRAAIEGTTIHVPDVLADPEYERKETAALGIRAVLSVPLKRGAEVIGVFGLARATVGPFGPRQIELVESFADQAVIAIENARLFEEVQAKTRDLEESLTFQKATSSVLEVIGRSASDLQPVLDVILDTAADLCHADMSVLRLMREGTLQHVASSRRNDPAVVQHARENPILPADRSSVAGRVALAGHTIHIPDVAQDTEYTFYRTLDTPIGSVLGVPLAQDGKVAGVIALLRRLAQPFTQRQIELVETFADQAVIAIENVRLFDEVQARTRDLQQALEYQTATSDVLNVISRSPSEVQPVLDVIIETAVRLCEADFGTIAQESNGRFFRTGQYGSISAEFWELMSHAPVEMTRGSITGRTLVEGKVVHILDAQSDPEYTWTEALQAEELRSGLGVPLLREGTPIGAIALVRRSVLPFTEKQIELVTTFADQAVIAIENARLFEEVQARTQDLTSSLVELRTAQDRLVQTEKLASLGQLTAGIAHEIKNPLNFVNNFAGLSTELIDELRESLDGARLDEKTSESVTEITEMLKANLEKVVQHGKRADSIVKNMLLHSRAGSGERRPSDINAIVEEALNLAYHGARAEKQGFNITLERSLDPAAGEVDLFPQEITRVLLNLISNGFYAATKRTAVAAAGYDPKLSATTKNLGDRVEIRIRDNGTGIPPDVKERMFNPFFTTKPAGEGTGLGLSLSHDIVVKQHSGTIEVETEPGSFTEFRIVLPRGAATLGSSGGNL